MVSVSTSVRTGVPNMYVLLAIMFEYNIFEFHHLCVCYNLFKNKFKESELSTVTTVFPSPFYIYLYQTLPLANQNDLFKLQKSHMNMHRVTQ